MAYANGQIPLSALTRTVIGGRLDDASAASADRLALAFYKHFGRPLVATDTYRELGTPNNPAPGSQWDLWYRKPGLAAYPGTSIHGEGNAVDFASNIASSTSAEHRWMDFNAGRYGWVNPDWAKKASRFEPWHWEYHSSLDRMKSAAAVRYPGEGAVGFGQSGYAVREVQQLLHTAGYRDISFDGDFGMGTGSRVAAFQARKGLTPDGVVGRRTRAALDAYKPRTFHVREVIKATHVYDAPGRLMGRLLPVGTRFTVWDGVAEKRFLTWYVQTTAGNWVRSTKTRKI